MGKQLRTIFLLVGMSLVLVAPSGAGALLDASATRGVASSPTLLWNTFLGGVGWDDGYAVAADANGNIYVTGTSDVSWGSPKRPYGGHEDAFVAKLNRNGDLLWNTFLGSATGEDYAYAIAVDGSGNINVSGESTDSWGSPLHSHSEDQSDFFVAQLSNNGTLKWHTFYGAFSIDRAYGLAVDGSGSIYVSGESHTSWGSPVNPPSSPTTDQEGFVAKLNSSGILQWNTFMGASGNDYAKAIAVDGSVVVTGHSENSWGAPVRAHSGDPYGDAFAAQLSKSNGMRQWHTFLGGASTDEGLGIATSGGESYVTGYSYATWGSPIHPFPGNSDNAFVARLNSSGALQWNTFMGGGDWEDDWGQAISVASGGRIHVAGWSNDTWGAPLNAHAGSVDAFVAQLSTSGALQWNTFVGGDNTDYGFAVASDDANIYVVGESFVAYGDWGNPVRPGSGSWDAWAVRLGMEPPDYDHSVLLPLIQRTR